MIVKPFIKLIKILKIYHFENNNRFKQKSFRRMSSKAQIIDWEKLLLF